MNMVFVVLEVVVALVVEVVVVDLSKQESEVMIPSYRRLCAPLVGELIIGTLKCWKCNLDSAKCKDLLLGFSKVQDILSPNVRCIGRGCCLSSLS